MECSSVQVEFMNETGRGFLASTSQVPQAHVRGTKRASVRRGKTSAEACLLLLATAPNP